jgi:hypothetical protein
MAARLITRGQATISLWAQIIRQLMLLNLGNNGKLQPCSTCVLASFFIWKFVTKSVRIPAIICAAQMFASFDGTSRQLSVILTSLQLKHTAHRFWLFQNSFIFRLFITENP